MPTNILPSSKNATPPNIFFSTMSPVGGSTLRTRAASFSSYVTRLVDAAGGVDDPVRTVGEFDDLVQEGRDRLDRERDQQRTAAVAETERAAAALARRDAAARAFRSYTVLRSLTRVTDLAIVAVLAAPFFVAFLWFFVGGWWAAAVVAVAMVSIAAVVRHPAAMRRLVGSLPFQVLDLGIALDANRSYPSERLILTFADRTPSPDELVAALAAVSRRQTVTCKRAEGRIVELELASSTGSKFDGQRRWLAGWFRRAAGRALVTLHEAYPLESIRFE